MAEARMEMVLERSPVKTSAATTLPWRYTRMGIRVGRLVLAVAIVLVWWTATSFRWLSPDLLPPPVEVAVAFFQLALSGTLWLALAQTLSAALRALGFAILVGVPIGLVLGLAPPVERSTRLLVDFGRSFPTIALLPVLILILGVNKGMEVSVVFLAVVWPIIIQTAHGSQRIDPVVRDTTRSYRINLWLRFVKVLLPAAAPFTATGIRISATVSLLLAIAVEMLTNTPGMGFNLAQTQVDERPDIGLAYVAFAGLLGFTLNYLLQKLEDKALVWHARADAGAGS